MMLEKRQLALLAFIWSIVLVWAQGPNNSGTYYQMADGKKASDLKTALFQIIKEPNVVSYAGLWTAYKQTDLRDDGKIWDMYSSITSYSPDGSHTYSKEGDGFNREHSFPKSWFSSAKPMYSDIVHVIPADGYVNNRRSNYPFGETKNPTYSSEGGFSKVGPCSYPGYSGTVFEPNDEYKGDFARIYFYMATCYENNIASWNSDMLAGNSYPAYKTWVINMLLEWATKDPVSEKEIRRNDAAYGIQKNRNPFVDYPGLEQYIWGNKKEAAFSYDNYDGSTNPDPDPSPDPEPAPDDSTVVVPDSIIVGIQTYKKITSTDELSIGGGYLIVCSSKEVAMSASNTDIRSYASITDTDGLIQTEVNSSGKPYQLVLGGTVDAYTFYDMTEKQYLSITTNKNKLNVSETASTDYEKWTVAIENGNARIASCAYPERVILYNSGSPRFATYTSSQTAVQLYKNVTPVLTVIGDIKQENAQEVDVYRIDGVKVRSNIIDANALSGLPRGLYIINKKKYVVK